jgi:hypothetical protein
VQVVGRVIAVGTVQIVGTVQVEIMGVFREADVAQLKFLRIFLLGLPKPKAATLLHHAYARPRALGLDRLPIAQEGVQAWTEDRCVGARVPMCQPQAPGLSRDHKSSY